VESVSEKMKKNIISRLSDIEKNFDVEIILAIESGSRAWGFESIDSDYDVRFIYRHKLKWYLQVLPKRDVIELPINDIDDYSGWDIKKALFLLNKSNPVLFEWLNSPIVYKYREEELNIVKEVSKKYFNPIGSTYHYLSMAKSNFREYLTSDYVKSKKYFYALRPILSCMWIEINKTPPPIVFNELLFLIEDQELLKEIKTLLAKKKSGKETSKEKRVDIINKFIEEHIAKFESKVKGYNPQAKPDSTLLDEALISIIEESAR
jgi:predicted nucleotidyltransferase